MFELDKLGKVGKIRFHYKDDVVLGGVYDGSLFQGSDKLSMAIMNDIEQFLSYTKNKCLIVEGDRFTNKTFIEHANPLIIRIKGSGEAGRKKRRSKQTDRQIKSIATRVTNIVDSYNRVIEVNDSNECLSEIVKHVKTNISNS
jgi:hypothetical protein